MTTYIEDIQKDIQGKNSFIADDCEIKFKRIYAYIRFFFSEGTCSSWNKIRVSKLQELARCSEGSIHSVLNG